MKVTLYIALWKRHKLAGRVVEGINELAQAGKKYGIDLDVVYVYSKIIDAVNYLYGLNPQAEFVYTPNEPLGDKFNAGLPLLDFKINSDADPTQYIMQIGSDDVISPEYWDHAMPWIEKDFDLIGCKNLIVENFYTGELKYLNFNDIFGAGRMIRASIFLRSILVYFCTSKQSDTSGNKRGNPVTVARHQYNEKLHEKIGEGYELWEPHRQSALDYNSETNILKRNGPLKIASIDKNAYLVQDIKTKTNIHKYEDL